MTNKEALFVLVALFFVSVGKEALFVLVALFFVSVGADLFRRLFAYVKVLILFRWKSESRLSRLEDSTEKLWKKLKEIEHGR